MVLRGGSGGRTGTGTGARAGIATTNTFLPIPELRRRVAPLAPHPHVLRTLQLRVHARRHRTDGAEVGRDVGQVVVVVVVVALGLVAPRGDGLDVAEDGYPEPDEVRDCLRLWRMGNIEIYVVRYNITRVKA
jgi:hypothetical protein